MINVVHGPKYSPLDVKIAILKHDIRRMVRIYDVNSASILAYLDKLVIDINVHASSRSDDDYTYNG